MNNLVYNIFYISCIDIIDDIKHVMKNKLFMCSVGKIVLPVGLEVDKFYIDDAGNTFHHRSVLGSFNDYINHPFNNGYNMIIDTNKCTQVYYSITLCGSSISLFINRYFLDDIYTNSFKSLPIWTSNIGLNFYCVKEHEPIFYFKK